ncbi:MAG: hypothetical protein WEC75_07505 [Dehalococcoidia bacterium]
MRTFTGPVHDFKGRIMFVCVTCREPLTYDDFFQLGLRMPETDETRDDYCDAELLDNLAHAACLRAGARAG